jgi:ATP-binding cassette subfamily B protein
MLGLIGSNLVVIYFGGVMYIDGRLKSIGTIVEFILYVNMYLAVASLGWISSMVQSRSVTKRLNEFLKLNQK